MLLRPSQQPPHCSSPHGALVSVAGAAAGDVAARAARTERLGAELALKLREAPDLGAVHADVGLDLGGGLADGGQVDAEQLRAPVEGAAIGRVRSGSSRSQVRIPVA